MFLATGSNAIGELQDRGSNLYVKGCDGFFFDKVFQVLFWSHIAFLASIMSFSQEFTIFSLSSVEINLFTLFLFWTWHSLASLDAPFTWVGKDGKYQLFSSLQHRTFFLLLIIPALWWPWHLLGILLSCLHLPLPFHARRGGAHHLELFSHCISEFLESSRAHSILSWLFATAYSVVLPHIHFPFTLSIIP